MELVVAFDTTVLTGAFLNPSGLNHRVLEIARVRGPVLHGFITDSVGAEFWWKTTQQGLKLRGNVKIWPESEVEEFLDSFDPIFDPTAMRQAPIGRELGSRGAGLVACTLGEALAALTRTDRAVLMKRFSSGPRALAEQMDLRDLHVLSGAIVNGATHVCSNDAALIELDPVGNLRVINVHTLAIHLGIVKVAEPDTVSP